MLYAFHLSANDMGGRWKGNIGSDDKPFFIIFNIEIHADSISGVADKHSTTTSDASAVFKAAE